MMKMVEFLCPSCTHALDAHAGRTWKCACGCTAPPPRFAKDGSVLEDLAQNPLAVDRARKYAEEQAALEAESAAPWGRDKIARLLDRYRKMEPWIVNGEAFPRQLDMHGVLLVEGTDLSSLDMSHTNLSMARGKRIRFVGSNLYSVNSHGAVFEDCLFEDAESLEAWNASESCLRGSSFSGVKAFRMGGSLGDERWEKGLTRSNLSGSCCHGSVRGLDIQEHGLTVPVTGEDGKALRTPLGQHHACECGFETPSIKVRIEHTVTTGHSSWKVKSSITLGTTPAEEPRVEDTRIWLLRQGRRPILKGNRILSVGPQLWRANVTGMLKGHKDRTPDPSKATISVSAAGLPQELVL